jgi:pimeloyl-ACP methyl ester carboxylesterase
MTSCCNDTDLKKDCRACAKEFFAERPQPRYGLNLTESLVDCDRAVLFVHGWNSRPEDMASLMSESRSAGLACASFRYPNDQPIRESSQLFAHALKQLAHVCPTTRISVVTHSMGGLVARDVLENKRNKIANVDRLVMLVPPNHGSHLAKYACSLDVYEYATSASRRDEAGFIAGSILDGLSEATLDMRPQSEFLRQLNARSRNPNVRYTIVLGTDGILGASELGLAKAGLDRAARRCRWVECVSNKVDAKAIKYDEIIDGQGDGIVSLQSGKLPGVSDVIVGRFSHGEILEGSTNREVAKVRAQVIKRLTM